MVAAAPRDALPLAAFRRQGCPSKPAARRTATGAKKPRLGFFSAPANRAARKPAQLVGTTPGCAACDYETASGHPKENDWNPFGESMKCTGIAQTFNLGFSTKYLDRETGLIIYPLRPYSATQGRFLTEDPMGEAGGVNLYGFVGNDPIDTFDPMGEDFIAVGTRPLQGKVGWLLGGKGEFANHLSIELYEGCAPEGTQFTSAQIPAGSKQEDARQLLQNPSDNPYTRNVSVTTVNPSGFGTFTWIEKENVGISFIFKTSTAKNLTVIYSDTDTDEKWSQIASVADAYPYAEHSIPGSALQNWPNSKYGIPGTANANNSNTFIRVLAQSIGRQADVVPGFHPGNDVPVPVVDKGPVPQPK